MMDGALLILMFSGLGVVNLHWMNDVEELFFLKLIY